MSTLAFKLTIAVPDAGISMSDMKTIAREVHELLLSAEPQSDNASLIKAAQLQSKATNSDRLQEETFLAIQKLRTGIGRGASAAAFLPCRG